MTSAKMIVLLSVALALSGCATVIDAWKGEQRAISRALGNDNELSPYNQSSVAALTSGDAQPMSYRFKQIELKTWQLDRMERNLNDRKFDQYPGKNVLENKSKDAKVSVASAPQQDEDPLYDAAPKTLKNESAWAQLYVNGRRNETKDYCALYFDGLSQISRVSEYGRETTGNLFNLTSVILGVTGAAAKQLTILAGSEAFISSQWDSYNRYQFLMPGPHLVKGKVFEAFKTYEDAHPITGVQSFDAAADWVRDYAYYCTELGIKGVIETEYKPKPASFDDFYSAQNHASQLQELRRKLKDPLLGSAPIVLFWRNVLGTSDAKEKEHVDKKLLDVAKSAHAVITGLEARTDAKAKDELSEINLGLRLLKDYSGLGEEAQKMKAEYQAAVKAEADKKAAEEKDKKDSENQPPAEGTTPTAGGTQ